MEQVSDKKVLKPYLTRIWNSQNVNCYVEKNQKRTQKEEGMFLAPNVIILIIWVLF